MVKTAHVRVTRDDRGFHDYGAAMKCSYGNTARVHESSSAEGPHVWLSIEMDREVFTSIEPGEASLHLNPAQARDLIRRLQTWLDEIPKRWGK